MGAIQSSINSMLGVAGLVGGFARTQRAKSEATQIENVKKDIEQAREFKIPEAEIEKSIVSQLPKDKATSLPETTKAAEEVRADFQRDFQKNDPYGYYGLEKPYDGPGVDFDAMLKESQAKKTPEQAAQVADDKVMSEIRKSDMHKVRKSAMFDNIKNKAYAGRQPQLTIPQVKTKAPTRKQASRNMQLSKSAQKKQWDEISRMIEKENK